MIQAIATDENDRCAQGAWPLKNLLYTALAGNFLQ
jgi:hypothetical protein